MNFVYKLVKMPTQAFTDDIEYLLNEYGMQGWELCCHECGYFIFKKSVN